MALLGLQPAQFVVTVARLAVSRLLPTGDCLQARHQCPHLPHPRDLAVPVGATAVGKGAATAPALSELTLPLCLSHNRPIRERGPRNPRSYRRGLSGPDRQRRPELAHPRVIAAGAGRSYSPVSRRPREDPIPTPGTTIQSTNYEDPRPPGSPVLSRPNETHCTEPSHTGLR